MARPSEYNEEILKKVSGYILSCGEIDEIKTRPVVKDGRVQGEEEFVKHKIILPTIEGLANYLGLHKDTIYDWRKKFPEFSDLIGKLLQKQAEMLIHNGLSGDYNPTIAKVLLTKHGYREGVEQTGADGKDLPAPIININRDGISTNNSVQ